MKAATFWILFCDNIQCISIHAAREGGDSNNSVYDCGEVLFQSTPPVKAATDPEKEQEQEQEFQSTPPVKAATTLSSELI